MTREDLIKHWDIIEAFRNGAEIQRLSDPVWHDVQYPSFNSKVEYRIKPEAEKPKYRPFTFEDRELFRGKWVKKKNFPHEYLITYITSRTVVFADYDYNYNQLFEGFTFIDGSPCGVEVNE